MEITPKNQEAWINSVVKNHELISELKKSVNSMNEEIIKQARELVEKYRTVSLETNDGLTVYPILPLNLAKQCALITCDEIINLDDFSSEGREKYTLIKQAIENL